ncbi:HigA family addiction module antidote protein [Agrobacterium rhizogenes]|nr:HigA family addiction module antidote protein [Rhizobium rhizogenes]
MAARNEKRELARPISPGAVLRSRILPQMNKTQDELAVAMGVSRFSVNQIINEKRAVTAEMSLRLGHVTSTSPEFWLNLQRDIDLFDASTKLQDTLKALTIIRKMPTADDMFQDVE